MDLLVPLYNLNGVSERIDRVGKHGVTVRLAMAYERDVILDWVRQSFDTDGSCWAGECEVALSRVPASCHIATRDGELLGFACFDATAKGMFGPTGTDEKARGLGVGAHVKGFYQKVVAAVEIADSEPGIYRDRIGRD